MSLSDRTRDWLSAKWGRWGQAVMGVLVFAAVISVGNLVLKLEAGRLEVRQRMELIRFGASLHARLDRELSSVLYLTNGLSSYLVAHYQDLKRDEVENILAGLYASAHHVRNLGIAVGYRLTYIYPIQGNEKAIGLNYADQPGQWPAVKRAIDSGKPVLAGPLALLQGGRGLVYRAPVFISGRYWGLLSTVVDSDSLLTSAFRDVASEDIAFAVRGTDGLGMEGDVFWGDAALFQRQDIETVDVEIPGGRWVIAIRAKSSLLDQSGLWVLRALLALLAVFLGWSTYVVLAQRAQLARMALFDPLTGLPNRHLIEDRIDHAIAAQRRNKSTVCALLFVDLDGFKDVNDRFGHKAGDTVLQGVARRVHAALRATDTVGRWGGDELLVLLENVDRQEIARLTQHIRQAVEAPLELAPHTIKVGASIGLAVVPEDGETVSDLLRTADARMYDDKVKRKPGGA
jgi:diguanylate cyclase (GGDEF)-like protein